MKITDFKNEEAIELLADIIEPTAIILGDADTRKLAVDLKEKKINKVQLISKVLKKHSKEAVEILARLDGQDPDEYECNILVVPQKALEIMNDKDLADFFTSQVQMMESESFGLHTESTEENEK